MPRRTSTQASSYLITRAIDRMLNINLDNPSHLSYLPQQTPFVRSFYSLLRSFSLDFVTTPCAWKASFLNPFSPPRSDGVHNCRLLYSRLASGRLAASQITSPSSAQQLPESSYTILLPPSLGQPLFILCSSAILRLAAALHCTSSGILAGILVSFSSGGNYGRFS